MPHLSEDGKRIVEAGRAAGLPAPELGARLWGDLSRRIAAGAGPSETVADLEVRGLGRAATAGSLKSGIIIVAVTVAIVGAAALLIRKPGSDPTQPSTAVQQPAADLASAVPPDAAPVPPGASMATDPESPSRPAAKAPARPRRPDAPARSRAPEEPVDRLARENRHIADAQARLQGQDYAGALAELGRHAAAFPDGVLTEEREVLRVLALCGLGRVVEAGARARRFTREYPGSAHAARVEGSCAGPEDSAGGARKP